MINKNIDSSIDIHCVHYIKHPEIDYSVHNCDSLYPCNKLHIYLSGFGEVQIDYICEKGIIHINSWDLLFNRGPNFKRVCFYLSKQKKERLV